uniref:Uncharacterized protein n=1 Tax=Arundo donax TaxID=35708 RepID=A0A0A8Y8T5_ARUDO
MLVLLVHLSVLLNLESFFPTMSLRAPTIKICRHKCIAIITSPFV